MGLSSSREEESRTEHAIKIPLRTINKVSKSICKISYKKNIETKNGTGFFMLLNNVKCIFTNYHIISKDLINTNINIELYNNNIINNKNIGIILNKKYIKFFEDLDITIIEIEDSYEDKLIKDIEFLDYDSNYIKGYDQYKNIDIFTLQYPRDDIEVASGKVIEIINNFEFKHSIDTEPGASGSPIILPIVLKVIGIHKLGSKIEPINYGTFIGEIFKNNRLNEKENNKEIKNNFINDNDNISKTDQNEFKNNNVNKGGFKGQTNKDFIFKKKFTLDKNFYSLQIETLGMETMNKIIKMKLLIVGLRDLGIEIAKNTILLGINEVQIYDPEMVKINDLGSNFYLNEVDVGKKRRDEACIYQLSELNPYINLSIMKGDLFENLEKFNIIIITEIMQKDKLELINEKCRKKNIGFIYASILGLSGFVFDDFGTEHTILDYNGEECNPYLIESISNDGIVTINNSYSGFKFDLEDGNFVKFSDVRGIPELNDGKLRKIKIISNNSFKIVGENFWKYPEYNSGGIVEQVKIPRKMYHKSLKERFKNFFDNKPIEPIDSSKIGRNELLFIIFSAIHEYYSKNNSLPELNNKNNIDQIIIKTKELYHKNNKLSQKGKLPWFSYMYDWDEEIPRLIASWARAEISPLCSFLGGIVSQEIIKYTGKYIPINQWLVFDFFETIEKLGEKVDRNLKNSRYDDQIAIFGNEIQKKIEESNIFLIGAGALGCEFLKNFSLMGISTSKDKQLIITDNDNIEISNLSNQFLFRKEDIGKSKSKCATDTIKKINPSFNCKNLQIKISEESEHIFTEDFWNSKTFIINAVDNIKARQYIDKQCTLYNKVLIDTGISDTKAHLQMIIPHITSCYNDSLDICEMKVRLSDCWVCKPPSNIEYCIKYGRKIFDEYLTYDVNDAKKLLEDRDKFFSEIKSEIERKSIVFLSFQITKLRFIKKYLALAEEQNINKLIEFSVNQYYKMRGLKSYSHRHIKSTIPYSTLNKFLLDFYLNLGKKMKKNIIN